MRFFVKTVVTGFALALGAALFKKVAREIGLDEPREATGAAAGEAATDEG